jgi:integrase
VSTLVRPPLLSTTAAARLLAAASEEDEGFGAFARLALVSGARRGELLGVRWPDLGWKSGSLLIACRDGGKTSSARRTIALDLPTMDMLSSWRAARRAALESKGIVPDEDGYAFALDLTGFRWPPAAVTRRVVRLGTQTGVSASVADLRRYSMDRLPMLGVGLDVICHRLGLTAGSGMLPLFTSAKVLIAADREAARLLGGELDQALAVPAPGGVDG